MSDDYSALENGSPNGPRRIPRIGSTPNLPQNVGPTSLELPFTPAYPSNGERMADQLSQALGLAGQAGNELNHIARQQLERDAAFVTRNATEQRHMDELRKGAGANAFAIDHPQVASDFANGKLPVPIDDPTDTVKTLVEGRIQKLELDSVAADEFRRHAYPAYTGLAVAARDKNRETAKADSFSLFGDRAVQASSADELAALSAKAKEMFPSATADEIAVAIPLRAMADAAHVGDPEKFAAAQQELGTRFGDKQDIAKVLLNDSVRRNQSAVDMQFEDAVSSKYGQPAAIIRQTINSWQGKASPERIRTELRSVDSEERAANAKAYSEAKAIDLENQKADLVASTIELMRSARATGGASQIPDRVPIQDLDGATHYVPRSEMVGPATDAEMFRLAKMPPERALPAQVEFLSNNGETYDGWKRVMEAGPMVSSIDIDKAGPKDIPSNLSKGYALYKSIGAINPRTRDRHIPDASTGRFYELAELAEKYVTPGDPNAALLYAMRAAKREPFGDNPALQVRSQLINDEIDRRASSGLLWWKQTVNNPNEVGAETARVADLYVHSLGISPQLAVDEASKRIDANWTVVNDWAVPTRGRNVPSVLPAAAKVIADEYARVHGADEGLTARDLVLQPADVPGLWVLTNKATLSPVKYWATEGRFTDSDFGKLLTDLQRGKEDAAAAEVSHGMNLPGAFKNDRDMFNEAVRSRITGDPMLADLLPAPRVDPKPTPKPVPRPAPSSFMPDIPGSALSLP